MVFSYGKTEVNTQGSIKKAKNTDVENMKKQMEMHSKDFSKMMFFKETEFIYIQMEIHMSVILKIYTDRERAYSIGVMEISMTESGIEI